MKLIESKAEYIPQEEGLEGIYKQIEKCSRTCYKSESKTTDTSYLSFIDRLVKSGHTAMLEHGTVYLKFKMDNDGMERCDKYYHTMPYSRCADDHKFYYISTNLRVLQENNWLDDHLKYLCPPTEFHERRYTMKFTCSRAISHELVRSRTMSFAQESQRYINYSKEKHGGEITYIIPSWIDRSEEEANSFMGLVMCGAELNEQGERIYPFFESLMFAEKNYFTLLNNGYIPQQARDVLPNATKTEIVVTGFSSDWRYLLDLRLFEKTGKVHPDMKDLMQKLAHTAQEAHITQNLTVWDDIMSKPSKFD